MDKKADLQAIKDTIGKYLTQAGDWAQENPEITGASVGGLGGALLSGGGLGRRTLAGLGGAGLGYFAGSQYGKREGAEKELASTQKDLTETGTELKRQQHSNFMQSLKVQGLQNSLADKQEEIQRLVESAEAQTAAGKAKIAKLMADFSTEKAELQSAVSELQGKFDTAMDVMETAEDPGEIKRALTVHRLVQEAAPEGNKNALLHQLLGMIADKERATTPPFKERFGEGVAETLETAADKIKKATKVVEDNTLTPIGKGLEGAGGVMDRWGKRLQKSR
jgi:hypothetical protein